LLWRRVRNFVYYPMSPACGHHVNSTLVMILQLLGLHIPHSAHDQRNSEFTIQGLLPGQHGRGQLPLARSPSLSSRPGPLSWLGRPVQNVIPAHAYQILNEIAPQLNFTKVAPSRPERAWAESRPMLFPRAQSPFCDRAGSSASLTMWREKGAPPASSYQQEPQLGRQSQASVCSLSLADPCSSNDPEHHRQILRS
jgi:hypothetical protein